MVSVVGEDRVADSDDRDSPPARQPSRLFALLLGGLAVAALGYAAFSPRWLYNDKAALRSADGSIELAPPADVQVSLRTITYGGEAYSNDELIERWRHHIVKLRYVTGEPIESELAAVGGDKLVSEAKALRESLVRESIDGPMKLHPELVAAQQVMTYSTLWAPSGWVTFFALVVAAVALAIGVALVAAGRKLAWPVLPTTVGFIAVAVALVAGCLFGILKPGIREWLHLSVGFFVFACGAVIGGVAALLLGRLLRPPDPDLLEDAIDPEQF